MKSIGLLPAVAATAFAIAMPAKASEFCGQELPSTHTWVNEPFIAVTATVGMRSPVPCKHTESEPQGSAYQIFWNCPTFTIAKTTETGASLITRLSSSLLEGRFKPTEDRFTLIDKTGKVFRLEASQVGAVSTSESCNSAGSVKALSFSQSFDIQGQTIVIRWGYKQVVKAKPVPSF